MRYALFITVLLMTAAIFPLITTDGSSGAIPPITRSDDDDMGNATVIELNDSVTDSLHNETDFIDWYKAPLSAGDIVRVNLTVPATGDFSLTVFDPNGEYLQTGSVNRMGGYEEVRFLANMTDHYYIEIFTSWGHGEYTLRVTDEGEYPPDGNDYIYTAEEITPPATIENELLEGVDEHDYYRVELGENDVVRVTMGYQPTQNFDLYLRDDDGVVLEESRDYTGYEELNHTAAEEGSYHIQATVVWGGGDYIMQVFVTRANRPPEITSRNPQESTVTIEEGMSAAFVITADDPESDLLSYSWMMEGCEITGENTPEIDLTTTYDGELSAGTHAVKVVVSDDFSSVNTSWELVVIDVNPAPELIVKWPAERENTIKENENLLFVLSVTDPDGTEPLIRWYEDGNKVNSSEGEKFNFKANYTMAGTHIIEVIVTDSLDDTLTVTKSWTVIVLNVDRPPVPVDVYPPTDTETDEENPVEFTFRVADPDGEVVSYAWYLDGGLLEGVDNWSYRFVPDYKSSDGIEHEIRVEAVAGGKDANKSWKLIVSDVNREPVLNGSHVQPESGEEFESGKKIEFRADVTDPDGDNLTYTWVILETGEEISGSNAFEKSLQKGHYTLLLTVDDGKGGKDSMEIYIDVKDREKSPGFGMILFICVIGAVMLADRIKKNR